MDGLETCQPSRKSLFLLYAESILTKQGKKMHIFWKKAKTSKFRRHRVNFFFIKFKIKKDALLIPYKESSLHVESKNMAIFWIRVAEEANRSQNVFYRP